MAENNVDNFFERPEAGTTDNALKIGGTMELETGATQTLNGDTTQAGTVTLTSSGDIESPGNVSVITQRVTVKMNDISTADSVWVSIGEACTFKKITSIIDGAIITADAVITTEIAGTLVTNGGLTIAFTGSAAGIVDTGTPTAANVLTASEGLEIITDGGSTNTVAAEFVVEFELS